MTRHFGANPASRLPRETLGLIALAATPAWVYAQATYVTDARQVTTSASAGTNAQSAGASPTSAFGGFEEGRSSSAQSGSTSTFAQASQTSSLHPSWCVASGAAHASGVSSGSDSGGASAGSSFFVAFSIDEPATFSFTGELTHGTVFGGTALFRKNDGGLFLTHSASESPTFADAGVLSPGTYTLVAFASVNISLFPGASLADSCGFDIALALGTVCEADFNLDASVDFFDYDDFVQCFEGGTCPIGRQPDFNADGTVDFFDYDDFAIAFELSC